MQDGIPSPQDAPAEPQHSRGTAGVRAKLREGFLRFSYLFIYLWLLFGLFALHQDIVLRQHGINSVAQGWAFFNALVLGKVMLVAEEMNLGKWLDKRPLIYPVLHQSFLFTLLFITFHVAEEMIVGVLFKGETARASVPVIGGGGFLGLLCVALIMFFALMPYFAFKNLVRALGQDQVRALVFGSPRTSRSTP